MALALSEPNAGNFSAVRQDGIATGKTIGGHDMPLTTVIITIVAAGLLLWLVNRFIPIQGQIKSILNAVVVIVLVLWIANLYGVFQHLSQFRVGR
jgi:hypothetical protein